MDNEKIINIWRKRCIRGGNTPIALVCVNKEGFPAIYSSHNKQTLESVWKHLASAPVIDEKGYLEGREN